MCGIHKLKCLIRICYTANAWSVWYGLLVRIRNLLILSKRVSNFFATVRSFFFWISVSVYDFYRALSSWFSYVIRFCMVYTVVYIVRNILFSSAFLCRVLFGVILAVRLSAQLSSHFVFCFLNIRSIFTVLVYLNLWTCYIRLVCYDYLHTSSIGMFFVGLITTNLIIGWPYAFLLKLLGLVLKSMGFASTIDHESSEASDGSSIASFIVSLMFLKITLVIVANYFFY